MKRVWEYNARENDSWARDRTIGKRDKMRLQKVISAARSSAAQVTVPSPRRTPRGTGFGKRASLERIDAELVELHETHHTGQDPRDALAKDMRRIFDQRLSPRPPPKRPVAVTHALLSPPSEPRETLRAGMAGVRRKEQERIERGNKMWKKRLDDIVTRRVSEYSRDVLQAAERQRLRYRAQLCKRGPNPGSSIIEPATARGAQQELNYSPWYRGNDPLHTALSRVRDDDVIFLMTLRHPPVPLMKVVMALMILVSPAPSATMELDAYWRAFVEWISEIGGPLPWLDNLWTFNLSMVPITNAVRALGILNPKEMDHHAFQRYPAVLNLITWIEVVCRSFDPQAWQKTSLLQPSLGKPLILTGDVESCMEQLVEMLFDEFGKLCTSPIIHTTKNTKEASDGMTKHDRNALRQLKVALKRRCIVDWDFLKTADNDGNDFLELGELAIALEKLGIEGTLAHEILAEIDEDTDAKISYFELQRALHVTTTHKRPQHKSVNQAEMDELRLKDMVTWCDADGNQYCAAKAQFGRISALGQLCVMDLDLSASMELRNSGFDAHFVKVKNLEQQAEQGKPEDGESESMEQTGEVDDGGNAAVWDAEIVGSDASDAYHELRIFIEANSDSPKKSAGAVSMKKGKRNQDVPEDVKAAARDIMKIGDGHSMNGKLTINEMRTFLSATQHMPFVDWLTETHGDHGKRKFVKFDDNDDGYISIHELEFAIMEFTGKAVATGNTKSKAKQRRHTAASKVVLQPESRHDGK